MRVVRSHKEKKGNYAPSEGLRYDGLYLIKAAWRTQRDNDNFKVCRYYFVRADNETAPWEAGGRFFCGC